MDRVIGILAHVDAGKTTFSEQLLYHAGVLRAPGRVDHGDAFLDAHPLERQRGITIFSDQAVFERGGDRFFWVDTPATRTSPPRWSARCLCWTMPCWP